MRTEVELLMSEAKIGDRPTYSVESYDTRSTNLGSRQFLPERVFFATETDYVGFLRIGPSISAFRQNVELTKRLCPGLIPWIRDNIARFDKHADEWSDILTVCTYFVSNPTPGLYARELPIQVHTKFVEEHQTILDSVLQHLLPLAIDPEADDFFSRFHLRDNEAFVEIRILDAALAAQRGFPARHFKVPLSELAALPLAGTKVLVVENRLPLLTLPGFPGTVGVFGGGNAVTLLAVAGWLRDCSLFYWGDLDEHGFSILARFRQLQTGVQSVLMDLTTFDHFAAFHVDYTPPENTPETSLSEDELSARSATVSMRKRLEQERISLPFAHAAIERAMRGRGGQE